MHDYSFVSKNEKSFYFECENDIQAKEFDKLVLEYQPPNEFYTFDSCLMFLKKIGEQLPEEIDEKKCKVISDLGVAAYLLMHEYKPKNIGLKVIGKKGKYVYFEHPEGRGEELEKLSYAYLRSPFQNYDSRLMALKKIGEYMPKK